MVKAELESEAIAISFPYSAGLVDKIRSITGRRWNPDRRVWLIPLTSLDELLALNLQIDWDKPLYEIREQLDGPDWSKDIDEDLKNMVKIEPYPYQWVGGAGFLPHIGNGLLADEMGLGKSFQAMIGFLKMYKDKKASKALVFCPASLKNQWLSELEKFTHIQGLIIAGDKTRRTELWEMAWDPGIQFVFVNYDLLLYDYKEVFDFCSVFQNNLVIILDEAQKIKNWKSKTSTMMKGGKIKEGDEITVYPGLPSRYKWLLTGTPLENSPEDLYNLFSFMRPDVLGNYFVFRGRYIILGHFQNIIGFKNLDKLHKIVAPYMLRRRVSDVENEFPEVRTLSIDLEMTPFQASAHEIIRSDLYDLIKSLGNADDDDRGAIMGRFALLMSCADSPELLSVSDSAFAKKIVKQLKPSKSALTESPKVEWIKDFIRSRMEANPQSKTVIFTKYERMQHILTAELSQICKVYILNGEMETEERESAKAGFWNDGNLFITTDAGATGLNLQCADCLINVDRPWNPAVLNQRNGRIRRLGSAFKSVTVINLTCINSIDEKIREVLYDKQAVFDQVIESNDSEKEVIQRVSRNIMAQLTYKKKRARKSKD